MLLFILYVCIDMYNIYIYILSFVEGTTLRNYLSKVLNCDPMRITKKYTGNSSTPLSIKNEENMLSIEEASLQDLSSTLLPSSSLSSYDNNYHHMLSSYDNNYHHVTIIMNLSYSY